MVILSYLQKKFEDSKDLSSFNYPIKNKENIFEQNHFPTKKINETFSNNVFEH
jgi:hypothetical protein